MKVAAAALVLLFAAAPSTTTSRKPPPKPPKAPAATTTTTTTVAPDGRQSVISSQLKTLRAQVEEASAEEAEALDRLDAAAARRRALDARLAALETEIAAVEREAATATARLDVLNADVARAEATLAEARSGVSSARSELAERAVTAYVHPPGTYVLDVLVKRRSISEVAAARELLRTVLEAQARSVERYQDVRDDLDAERAAITAVRQELAAQQAVVAARRDVLVAARGRQSAVRAEAAEEEEEEQRSLLEEVRGRVKSFEAQIASLRKESDSIAALLRARQSGQKAAAPGSSVLAAPVPGVITSGFGPRRHPVFGTTRMHTGVDFSATAGTPIRAAADGVAVVAGDRGGYGTTVILDHGNGLATLYAHQSRLAVAPGAAVARGTIVGYAGSTGYSTGPHLHFEVRSKGSPVDPQRYL